MSPLSLRPIVADWEDAGVLSALVRLAARGKLSGFVASRPWIFSECFYGAVASSRLTMEAMVSTRIKVGEELEAQAVAECVRLSTNGGPSTESGKARVAQLYFDTFAVATWVDSHVHFLVSKQRGEEEPPPPNITSISNAFTSLDLSHLYERRTSLKSCPRSAHSLLQLLSRCTNPGARGWNPVLEVCLKNTAIRRIITHEFEIVLTAMHPQIHPRERPDWRQRFKIFKVVSDKLANEATAADIMGLAIQTKEVMRRLLATTMANTMAMHEALSHLGHPVKHLHQPPINLPHVGMERAMRLLKNAGVLMALDGKTSLLDAVLQSFKAPTPSLIPNTGPGRSLPLPSSSSSKETETQTTTTTTATGGGNTAEWQLGWLGKGTSDVPSITTLVEMTAMVWSSSFRASFLAFWLHGISKRLRLLRIDPVQHQALHAANPVTHLCAAIPLAEQLRLQRLVLKSPASALYTVTEAATAIGISVKITLPNSYKNAADAVAALNTFDRFDAARLFFFARVAWVRETVQIVRFGERVTIHTTKVLARRMRRPDDLDLSQFQAHSTQLCVCTECQRVANAHVSSGVGDKQMGVLFNEIGVSQSMAGWTGIACGNATVHCAKRSSAALRTAINFQSLMAKRKIESEDVDDTALDLVMQPRPSQDVESGIAARVRRDAKNALEGRAQSAACGDTKLLLVPLVGRGIRIYGAWYTHCYFCAAVVKATPIHKYDSRVCCLRCDHTILYRNGELNQAKQATEQRVCRFCGLIDDKKSDRWKTLKAPLDIAGHNSSLPPPLRRVSYCPQHFRHWVSQAHRVLQTRVILAHLATGARPLQFNETTAATNATAEEDDEVPTPLAKKPRKKRRLQLRKTH